MYFKDLHTDLVLNSDIFLIDLVSVMAMPARKNIMKIERNIKKIRLFLFYYLKNWFWEVTQQRAQGLLDSVPKDQFQMRLKKSYGMPGFEAQVDLKQGKCLIHYTIFSALK